MTWKVYVEMQPWRRGSIIHVVRPHPDGSLSVMGPAVIENAEAGAFVPEGQRFFEGNEEDARELMQAFLDAAWERGLRPQNFSDHTNELRATREHLLDMRRLAFKAPLPPDLEKS